MTTVKVLHHVTKQRLQRVVSLRHGFASVSTAPLEAPLSRFEPDLKVDYTAFTDRVATLRKQLGRPLTYAEKVLFSHLDSLEYDGIDRGKTQLSLRPRRIACQDATAQMALIQFMSAGLDATSVPTTVHCDHLIVGRDGQDKDLPNALSTHGEVYDFMSSACQRYNMGFWKPGAGIIHQTVLENYAYPAGMMVGTDSHTPNAGGLGMIAIGVGGADAVDIMAGLTWELTAPKIIGVKLTGKLSGWATPKDIISQLASVLTVKGGTGSIIEFIGEGTTTLSATGMATVCNMGAETGATTSIFPYTQAMSRYLEATGRPELAHCSQVMSSQLCADADAQYDRIIDIDLSTLEPRINGPFTPDLSNPISKFKSAAEENAWPQKLTAGLIGSCTNSSFEDLSRAASLAKQALEAGLKPNMPLLLSPGSEKTRVTLDEAGIMQVFEELGSTTLTNACGPCCGSWDRQDMKKVSQKKFRCNFPSINEHKGTPNSIITSYNRNFTGRLDSNPQTHIFLSSPEIVMAKLFSDDLGFDPTSDSLKTDDGSDFRFSPPSGDALPKAGFADTDYVYTGPSGDRQSVEVQISPSSQRLSRLQPFAPWSGSDFVNCAILIKVKGKCTTDHITPAGPWFRYRGHLENISNNTLIGAVNAENGDVNNVRNVLTGENADVPGTARHYQQHNQPWIVVADHNYGEGSSREHAALQPRYLGGVAVIAKSFARIHETNLKKQGMLALTFKHESDYDRLSGSDRIDIIELKDLTPGASIRMRVTPAAKGSQPWETELNHSFTSEQVEFFRAGSALNLMASRLNVA